MENTGTFYGRLEYFTAIWYILWSFGNVVVIWHIFLPFWYFYVLCLEKSGNPEPYSAGNGGGLEQGGGPRPLRHDGGGR
jgi:hypothetical protein